MRNLLKTKSRSRFNLYKDIAPKIYKTKYECYHTHFTFHQYDDDPFPSVPHGHSEDNRFKLDLRNGDIYDNNKSVVANLTRRDFDKLKRDTRLKSVIAQAQKYYKDRHPNQRIDSIPWCNTSPECYFPRKRNRSLKYLLHFTISK